jgi:hypothetical protein
MVFSVSDWVCGWHSGHPSLSFRRKTDCWHSFPTPPHPQFGQHVQFLVTFIPRSHPVVCMFSLGTRNRRFNILIIRTFSPLHPERVCKRWGELAVPAAGRKPSVASELRDRPTSVLAAGFQSSRGQRGERLRLCALRCYVCVSSGPCGTCLCCAVMVRIAVYGYPRFGFLNHHLWETYFVKIIFPYFCWRHCSEVGDFEGGAW